MRAYLTLLLLLPSCEHGRDPERTGLEIPQVDRRETIEFCRRSPARCDSMGLPLPPVIDAAVRDVVPPGPEAGPNAPWVSGRWRLPSLPYETRRPSGCGRATPLSNWWHFGSPRRLCRTGGTFFVDTQGDVFRFDPSFSSTSYVLGGRVGASGRIECTPNGFVAAVSTPSTDRNDAIVRFGGPDSEGRVLWATQRGTASHPAAGGGFYEFAATDSMVAWVHVKPGGGLRFYVADAEGRNARDIALAIPDLPYHLDADGDRLVFVAGFDLWLYTRSTDRIERLTRERAVRREPFLSGDRLVWIDDVHNPGTGELGFPNPEVYFMDLRDRTPIRITHDPSDRPVVQEMPSVRGDWIVWNDLRHSHQPHNRDPRFTSEIYGYHLGTRREYAIAADHRGPMSSPVIFDGEVYFHCSSFVYPDGAPPTFDGGLYRTALPTP